MDRYNRGDTNSHSLLSNFVFVEIARRLRKAMIHQLQLPLTEIPLRYSLRWFGRKGRRHAKQLKTMEPATGIEPATCGLRIPDPANGTDPQSPRKRPGFDDLDDPRPPLGVA